MVRLGLTSNPQGPVSFQNGDSSTVTVVSNFGNESLRCACYVGIDVNGVTITTGAGSDGHVGLFLRVP